MSGSFESVRWNGCVHRLDLGLYSHPKEFLGNDAEPTSPIADPLIAGRLAGYQS